VLLVGCGAATPARVARETEGCRAERLAIRAAIVESRQRPCATDDECVVITSPDHPSPELAEVVHRTDSALDARASAHLGACGAWAHHEAIDAIPAIEARCVDARCAAEETVLHVDE
jgi:hypothetical protein